jgi:DNA invertase Pin-like site-specific DNA recombinase
LSEDKKKQVRKLYLEGIKPAQIMKGTGVGKTPVFKIVEELRQTH